MDIMNLLQWTLVVVIILLLVTHAQGVAQIIAQFAKFWVAETQTLSGLNFGTASQSAA